MNNIFSQALALEYNPGSSGIDLQTELRVLSDQNQAIDELLRTGDVETFLDFTEWNLARSTGQPQHIDEYLAIAENNIEFLCPGLL